MSFERLKDAPIPFKGTEIHTLPNGLRLILKSDPTIPVVALQVWAGCGAVNESPKVYGISHGLEHMVFKGSPTRSAEDITRAIESNGGSINAATQLETTHYYIDIPAYGALPALEVLADTILNPSFPQEELERERLVILEEISRRNDSPDATLWDEFSSNIFKNTPYEIKVIGSVETVSALTRDDLFKYFHAHYVPSNMAVVAVGDFDKKEMLENLTRLFGSSKAGRAPDHPIVTLKNNRPVHASLKRPVQISYLAMGKATVGLGDPDIALLDVLADVLSGGVSSRFYQSLREEKQAVLSVSCDYIPHRQKGLFAFFIEALPERALQAKEELINELKNIALNPFRDDELNRARARIKSEWLHGSETPHGQASTLGELAVQGRLDLVSSYLSKIEKLTVKDLMEAYKQHLKVEDFFVTELHPES